MRGCTRFVLCLFPLRYMPMLHPSLFFVLVGGEVGSANLIQVNGMKNRILGLSRKSSVGVFWFLVCLVFLQAVPFKCFHGANC